MSWKGPPPSASLPSPDKLRRIVADAIDDAEPVILDALRDGTPVQSGTLRDSWRRTSTPDETRFAPTAPHAPYVRIDYTAADDEAQALGRRIGAAANRTFGG